MGLGRSHLRLYNRRRTRERYRLTLLSRGALLNRACLTLLALCWAAPLFAQGVTTFTLADGPHVVYVDQNGNLGHASFNGAWHYQNITSATSATAAAATSGLATFTLSDGPHVAYVDQNGNLSQIAYATASGTWSYQNVAALAGGPPQASAASGIGHVDGSNGPHIAYVDKNGNFIDVTLAVSTGTWSYSNLTATTGSPLASTTGGIAGFSLSGTMYFVYIDKNGALSRIWYTPGTGWSYQNLASLLSAPAGSTSTGLAYFGYSDGPHIAYIDQSGNLSQVWLTTATGYWAYQNLTAAASSPQASVTSGLTAFLLSDGPHIVYVDAYGDLSQEWYTSATNTWQYNNLTGSLGAPQASLSAEICFFSYSDGPHVAYLDSNGYLSQAWYTNSTGAWAYQNLGVQLGAPPAFTPFAVYRPQKEYIRFNGTVVAIENQPR